MWSFHPSISHLCSSQNLVTDENNLGGAIPVEMNNLVNLESGSCLLSKLPYSYGLLGFDAKMVLLTISSLIVIGLHLTFFPKKIGTHSATYQISQTSVRREYQPELCSLRIFF